MTILQSRDTRDAGAGCSGRCTSQAAEAPIPCPHSLPAAHLARSRGVRSEQREQRCKLPQAGPCSSRPPELPASWRRDAREPARRDLLPSLVGACVRALQASRRLQRDKIRSKSTQRGEGGARAHAHAGRPHLIVRAPGAVPRSTPRSPRRRRATAAGWARRRGRTPPGRPARCRPRG